MGRIQGTFLTANNYELGIRRPLDARLLVAQVSDLTDTATWTKYTNTDGTKFLNAYKGMIVACAEDASIYVLKDLSLITSLQNGWTKIGANVDISALTDAINAIDDKVNLLESTVDDLANRVSDIEEDADVIPYAYFSALPTIGTPGKLYTVTDTASSYIWVQDDSNDVGGKYICVGDSTASYTLICGGDASAD